VPDLLVTGATGQLGRLVVESLLREVPPSRIAVLARDPGKAQDLAALGVEVRLGDYGDALSLDRAFAGISRLLLISSNDLQSGGRAAHHRAAIEAAARAGVGFLAYTSVLHADASPLALAEDHCQSEAALRASGIPHAVLRNGWYTENYLDALKGAVERGAHHGCAGTGRVASASRADYAEAAARTLLAPGSAGQVYELAGDASYDFPELVAEAARATGRPVAYVDLPEGAFREALAGAGLPPILVTFSWTSTAPRPRGARRPEPHPEPPHRPSHDPHARDGRRGARRLNDARTNEGPAVPGGAPPISSPTPQRWPRSAAPRMSPKLAPRPRSRTAPRPPSPRRSRGP
jgi:NAD(P)H dehydrogenase (quinone)